MNQNIKRLVLSVLVILIFSASHSALGMEDFRKNMGKGFHNARRQVTGFFRSPHMTEQLEQTGAASKELPDSPFTRYPDEIKLLVIEYVAIANDGIGDLRKVCKNWHRIIKENKGRIRESILSAVYHRFRNGRLIYKPNKDNDIGMVELRISDLANPLEGTFDLSQCGDAGQYLSISTGYKKGKKVENANKQEIWFTPRFLVEKEINTSAKHFSAIFPSSWSDSAPVGMFWTWGGWGIENYNYLTNETMENLSKINLYENYKKTPAVGHRCGVTGWGSRERACLSCFVCELK